MQKVDYSKFYTPPQIAHALIKELSIPAPRDVIDICCGSCNLLYAAKKRWPNTVLYGTDITQNSLQDVIFEKTDGREYAINHCDEFSLVLANPPFDFVDEKRQFPRLFTNEFENYSTSRLEVEMLIANLKLLKQNGVLLIILPSSFVEAETYRRIRRIISNNYYVECIIKLNENTFGSSKINSYALIIRKELQSNRKAKLGVLSENENNGILFNSSISSKVIKTGCWVNNDLDHTSIPIDMRRGNVSSSSFITKGQAILHTAKNDDSWKPSIRYISKKHTPTIFAESGDIIVSRIGKSAGRWCVYNGEKIAISDCLYRIKDPNNSIKEKINGKRFNKNLKGVATKYITMSDFYSWIIQC